ncbi:MAG TPA: Stp1/IreP family PP2C-type Ser/Thr phosphatase [Acidimicrobiales bacterium]|nr:Stp1/IreP family PP2C-type Ser/Thr phosphatase [Acidimicrobiales bacterium]
MTNLRSGSATDVGRVRQVNQDRALESGSLFAVADGMGGHVAGEIAAHVAVEALENAFGGGTDQPSAERLLDAVEAANQAVWERARDDPALRGMGTTLTAVALVQEKGREELALANVGDSRAYLLSGGELGQVTADHSLVEDLVRSGQIKATEAATHPKRHVLTRALGMDPSVEVDAWLLRPVAGDRILLCSDGLINEVDDEVIGSVLQEMPDPAQAAGELVTLARDHGGSDNITVVVVDVVASEEGDPGGETLAGGAAEDPPGDPSLATTDGGSADAEADPGADLAPPDPAVGGGTALATRVTTTTLPAPTPTAPAPARTPPATAAPEGRPARAITLRVVAFLALLGVVVVGAVAAVGWYARDSYFVGLVNQRVVIYQGRPGGFLWFQPQVVERTALTSSQVFPSRLPDLRRGMQEPSLPAARRYVANLSQEARSRPPRTGGATPPPPSGPGVT